MKEVDPRYHPFSSKELAIEGKHSRLHELENNPDYFAKHIAVKSESGNGSPSKAEPKDFKELRQNFEADLADLKKYLGKFLPEFHIAYLAQVPDQKAAESGEFPENSATAANAYMFIKKVTENRDLQKNELQEKAKQLDDFIEKSGELFKNTFRDGKGFAVDLKPEHFMFGTTPGKPAQQLYFVDLYPRFHLSKKIFASRLSEITLPYIHSYNFPKVQKLVHELEELD